MTTVGLSRAAKTRSTPQGLTRRPWWTSLIIHGALLLGALVMLYPLLWMVSASIKPDNQIFSEAALWPRQLDLSNYPEGWNTLEEPFTRFFLNSLIVSLLTVIGNVLSCSVVAYAFARLTFPLRRLWFALLLVTIMLPHHVTMIPQYTLFFSLDWIDTFLPLVVPNFLATSAFSVFLMVQFIRTIPRELDDAARVDGCGPFSVYWRIILPLSMPATVTVATLSFINSWDEFLGPLIYLSSIDKYTVPLALRLFVNDTGESSIGPMFAMSVLSLVPVFVFFLILRRRIMEGIATTGLKG